MPAPYLMRDWKQVALGYDSLVFNLNLTGQYLPLVWVDNNATNYSGQRFGLHTVVGTTVPTSAEAINCIPAVVGATLAGADKSNQNGYNWVEMCQEWFNKKNGLMVYKNNADDQTSDDWWYETMPNVFFYQLYSLYPNTGDFKSQFISVADQFLKSVYVMGGSTTPWQIPNMNYQGFDFSSMTPSTLHDHNEPEAAGATAWILYNAYKVTGQPKYRVGAELAMEFLNGLNSNPAYELQLYYGVYMAARMNAELGTDYNVTKMLNWCFNSDNIRNWGVMTGSWGGYDVDGLIGEINSSLGYGGDYPFTMNTFEQIGTLVPMVRYDERYARAIGKLVLNAANAARLFYPGFLPAANQDPASKQWADKYDTNSYIAHESMHQYYPNNSSISPYATGDAERGGWGLTNLALYGASHVGILGGIIDTTNVKGILQLDLLKTDYFHDKAYPTYLYFNPYDSAKTVNINAGNSSTDIYDVVSKAFLQKSVTGQTVITIPANSAVLAVLAPAGGTQSFDQDKFLINNVVVDYHSGKYTSNYPPRIKSLSSVSDTVLTKDSVKVYCTAVDQDGDQLSYNWRSSGGMLIRAGSSVTWAAPDSTGKFTVSCTVSDNNGNQVSAADTLLVVKHINQTPVITRITATPRKINLGSASTLICYASDTDNDSLQYNWSSSSGNISGSGSKIIWTAPATAGNYFISCSVNDGQGSIVTDSIGVEVRDFSIVQTGELAAYYPFNGNAYDASGNNNNGTVYGATLTTDRLGNPNSAYFFNGQNSYIQIPSSSSLNFQNSITINFGMKVGTLYSREQYVLSQGSYDNRLKISIIPDQSLRWTIKTNSAKNGGIIDLDSETKIVQDSLYNVTVLYSGSDYEIYINGNLDAFSSWSGQLLQTSIPLTIGQMLPNDNNYNFRGVLDDIRIYNYALPVSEIESLANISTYVNDSKNSHLPDTDMLYQNYPNPFNPETAIGYQLSADSYVTLKVYDILGNLVKTLVNQYQTKGEYSLSFNASGIASGIYFYRLKAGNYSAIRKMILLK